MTTAEIRAMLERLVELAAQVEAQEKAKNYDGYWNTPAQTPGCWEIKGDVVFMRWSTGEVAPSAYSFEAAKAQIDAGRWFPSQWLPEHARPKPQPADESKDNFARGFAAGLEAAAEYVRCNSAVAIHSPSHCAMKILSLKPEAK
jgi:hypothetical protein